MTEGTFPKADGDVLYASEINTIYNIAPIGSVTAWLKSYTNTPTLPSQWVECNGQTLSDADSVYNGQVIPDLNSAVDTGLKGRFLRGHLSSGEIESSQNLAHTHTIQVQSTNGSVNTRPGGSTSNGTTASHTSSSSGETEARPHNYSVVWIMRIK